jgi:hypothetical protein
VSAKARSSGSAKRSRTPRRGVRLQEVPLTNYGVALQARAAAVETIRLEFLTDAAALRVEDRATVHNIIRCFLRAYRGGDQDSPDGDSAVEIISKHGWDSAEGIAARQALVAITDQRIEKVGHMQRTPRVATTVAKRRKRRVS